MVSATPSSARRGQRKAPADSAPTFGPSSRLDIEAELGFVVGPGTALGEPVAAGAPPEHLFGVVLVNDWSARDMQAWEYVPLGPFLGKSSPLRISPWVVPLDALEARRVARPAQDPKPLPYLAATRRLRPGPRVRGAAQRPRSVAAAVPTHVLDARPDARPHDGNGASLRTGDLYASGTVSGPEPDQRGSLIELTWNGREPLTLPDGKRPHLPGGRRRGDDHRPAPGRGGVALGFGQVTGTIRPAPTVRSEDAAQLAEATHGT